MLSEGLRGISQSKPKTKNVDFIYIYGIRRKLFMEYDPHSFNYFLLTVKYITSAQSCTNSSSIATHVPISIIGFVSYSLSSSYMAIYDTNVN